MWYISDCCYVTNVEAAEKLIRAREIQECISSIETAATTSMLHDHLRVRNRGAGNPPPPPLRQLTDQQRRGQVWVAAVCIAKVQRRPFKIDLASSDRRRNCRCHPETKTQSVTTPKDHAEQRRKMAASFFWKSGLVATISSWGQTDSHSGLARAPLSPEDLEFGVQRRPKTGERGYVCVCVCVTVAVFFIVKTSVRTQQQQRSTFSKRARCSCCRAHHGRQTWLPVPRSEETAQGHGTALESAVLKTHDERSRGLLKAYADQPGLRSKTSGLAAWHCA